MGLKAILFALAVLMAAPGQLYTAQQPKTVPRIGVLHIGKLRPSPDTDAFRQGLRELGYNEGKNIAIE